MKQILFILLLIPIFANSQRLENETDEEETITFNRDLETKETIEWLNNKFVEYKFKTPGIDQVFIIYDVEIINNTYCLTGRKEQNTDNSLSSYKLEFEIPIIKINSLKFEEKKENYWLVIRMVNNMKSITANGIDGSSGNGKMNEIEIMLSKTIDSENLRPRILKGFKYLLSMYGFTETEKF